MGSWYVFHYPALLKSRFTQIWRFSVSCPPEDRSSSQNPGKLPACSSLFEFYVWRHTRFLHFFKVYVWRVESMYGAIHIFRCFSKSMYDTEKLVFVNPALGGVSRSQNPGKLPGFSVSRLSRKPLADLSRS